MWAGCRRGSRSRSGVRAVQLTALTGRQRAAKWAGAAHALGGSPIMAPAERVSAEPGMRAVLTVMTWNVENFFAPQLADQAAYEAKLPHTIRLGWLSRTALSAVAEVVDLPAA